MLKGTCGENLKRDKNPLESLQRSNAVARCRCLSLDVVKRAPDKTRLTGFTMSKQCQMVVSIADDLAFLGLGIPDLRGQSSVRPNCQDTA